MTSPTSLGALRPFELTWVLGSRPDAWAADGAWYRRTKRMLDVALCLMILPCALPLLLVCAIAIQLESSGSVMVHERCTGRGGRPFRRYRLRTARCGPGLARLFARRADVGDGIGASVPGVSHTWVGRLLEGTGIAGLPQIVNVLRGDMSLVGPRPVSHGIGADRLWHTARFDVQPGIVSAARVGRRDSLSDEECVRLDIAYIRNATLVLDLQILLKALDLATRAARYLLKRALDVAVASALLVVLAPVIAGVAVAIRRSSPGPVLFRQSRLGLHGRPFEILKFRTMRPDAEAVLVASPALYQEYVANDFKLPLETDPRVTPIGRWLRRTSLDELPQLLNVIRGDMSLVGPRPVVPAELAHYEHRAPTFLSVLPGVTGAWQVSGRNNIRYPERCDVELEYVDSWSLTQDFVILVRTVGSTISGRGAL